MGFLFWAYIYDLQYLAISVTSKGDSNDPPCCAENFTEMLDFQGTHGMFAGDLIQAQQTCRNLRNHLDILGRQKRDEKKWKLKIDLELLDQIVAQIMKHHEKWWNMKHHERWWKNVRMAQFPIPILKKKRCFPRAKSWNIVPGGLPDSRAASGSALPTPRNSTGIGPRRECRCVDICNTTEDVSRTVWTSDGNNLDLNGCWGPVKVWLAMAWYGLVSVGIGLYWTWPKLEFAASTCGGWHAVATSKDLLSCQNSSKYSSTQQSEPLKNWLRTITLTLSQWFFHKLCYIPNKKDPQAWSTYDPLTLR